MKTFIHELIDSLDYRNEFTTKEFVLYTVIATVSAIIIACGESIILNLF